MKEYWFRVNDIDHYVDIVFRNPNYDLINLLFHLVDITWLEELRDGISNTAAPDNNDIHFKKKHGDWKIMTMKDYAWILSDLDNGGSVCLALSLFTNALEDYISKYHQYVS